MRYVPVALVLCLSLLVSSIAAAQSDELAKGHYMAGQAYYNQARYTEAIREFEEAYRLSPKPELLYNIAQAYERMGNIVRAVEYLQRFVADPKVKDRAAVEERIRNLQARLKQTGIQLRSTVDGATVQVDGKEVGKTPLADPIHVEPGSHEVRVSKQGFEPFAAFISVTAGNLLEVNARLAAHAETGAPGGQQPPAAPRRHGYVWTWVAAGTSAALLVTCAVTGGLALKRADDAGSPPNQNKETANSARNLALASDITLGVGLGAAAAATALFFYERKLNREQSRPAAVVPMLGPRNAGLAARFSF